MMTAICLIAFTATIAAAQPPHAKAYGKHKFYYYPSSNVYYDATPGLYYYNSGNSWTGVKTLPPGFVVASGTPRYVVYHQGPDVWMDNKVHVVKYKEFKNKPMKVKQGKAHGKAKGKH